MNAAPDRYGVIGYPIAHSGSPQIHRMFAAQTGQHLVYERLEAKPEDFERAVREFAGNGGRGLNVTVPHKEAAAALADRLSGRAAEAGAVNTLSFEPEGIYGDNTDGAGLLRDLTENLGVKLEGSAVLVLGAGGAARGILAPLLAARPARLVIANRTVSRAEQLVERFGGPCQLAACALDDVPALEYALVVNATSATLTANPAAAAGEAPAWPDAAISPGTFCYDLSYQAEPTPFCAWAQARGARRCVMGFGMLVEQAAESFALWRGIRPDTAPVLRALAVSAS